MSLNRAAVLSTLKRGAQTAASNGTRCHHVSSAPRGTFMGLLDLIGFGLIG